MLILLSPFGALKGVPQGLTPVLHARLVGINQRIEVVVIKLADSVHRTIRARVTSAVVPIVIADESLSDLAQLVQIRSYFAESVTCAPAGEGTTTGAVRVRAACDRRQAVPINGTCHCSPAIRSAESEEADYVGKS